MVQSMTYGDIADKEFALLVDQEHFEKVWAMMLPRVEQYATDFIESISSFGNMGVMEYAYSAFVKELIEKEYPTAQVSIGTTGGLCSYYAEKGGVLVAFEKN